MEKFGGVLKLECEYRLNKEDYKWSAEVLAELPINSCDNKCYNIEGPFMLDESISYIIGMNAIDKNKLSFTILKSDNSIMEYNLLKDHKTNIYYGSWNYIKDNKRFFGGYAKININEVEKSIYDLDNRIEEYGHNKFYPKYSNIVSNLLLTKKPTINEYPYETFEEMYKYSKNYFVTEKAIVKNLLVKKI